MYAMHTVEVLHHSASERIIYATQCASCMSSICNARASSPTALDRLVFSAEDFLEEGAEGVHAVVGFGGWLTASDFDCSVLRNEKRLLSNETQRSRLWFCELDFVGCSLSSIHVEA